MTTPEKALSETVKLAEEVFSDHASCEVRAALAGEKWSEAEDLMRSEKLERERQYHTRYGSGW
jgi:hypothetical protein